MSRPVVKWAGGKARLLPELRRRLPPTYGRYFEPFAGGAALFFALEPTLATLGDTNRDLIEMYRAVQDRACAGMVLSALEDHRAAHSKEYYYNVRDAWNTPKVVWETMRAAAARRAAAFIYLNRACYNGLWRVNKQGAFNVPCGDKPPVFDAGLLQEASRVLEGVTLITGGYEDTTATAVAGDFVYFDPPYDSISKAAFTAYTKDSFGDAEQEALALHAETLHRRGVSVMLSNHDTPFIRNLYRGFHIAVVHCGRAINSKGGGRGKAAEVIITSYPTGMPSEPDPL